MLYRSSGDKMVVEFVVGEKFSSFQELEKKIHNYEETEHAKLWKRDSRTIRAAIKKRSISAEQVPTAEEQILRGPVCMCSWWESPQEC